MVAASQQSVHYSSRIFLRLGGAAMFLIKDTYF